MAIFRLFIKDLRIALVNILFISFKFLVNFFYNSM